LYGDARLSASVNLDNR